MEKSIEQIKRDYSPLLLAYLGDAFYETLAREYVVGDGNCSVSRINENIKLFVTAVSQSAIAHMLLAFLDETETEFYKYGRNARNSHRSKSAHATEYRRATGMECLFGFLYVAGRFARARELFALAAEYVNSQEDQA